MLVFYRTPLTANLLWFPVLFLHQTILAIGMTLIGSAVIVFFRDVRFIVPMFVQVWMYASPVIYPLSLVPERLRWVYAINPVVGIIESYRNIFIRGTSPDWTSMLIGSAVTLFLLFVGYRTFKRLEPAFADII
jgi:lipopolysaccharide transport system permease protein